MFQRSLIGLAVHVPESVGLSCESPGVATPIAAHARRTPTARFTKPFEKNRAFGKRGGAYHAMRGIVGLSGRRPFPSRAGFW